MKKTILNEEINKRIEKLNYFNIVAAMYCYATNSEPEAGKKIIRNMFDNSIEDFGKKLSTIDNNIDKEKSS